MERVSLEAAFLLHSRAYRETSGILELLTRDHGRISLVARGLRRPSSTLRAVLQPFRPVMVSWTGRGASLMTLRGAEPAGPAAALQGTALMAAFYVNELVLRFLHKGDPHPRLFADYAQAIGCLDAGEPAPAVLRRFELRLLAESGYGLNLDYDAISGEPLDPQATYQYVVERGPVPAPPGAAPDQTYAGADLLAIGSAQFTTPGGLASAQRLLRAVLDHHLGARPLRTRQVFAAMRRQRP